jgi:hypothetical protein
MFQFVEVVASPEDAVARVRVAVAAGPPSIRA